MTLQNDHGFDKDKNFWIKKDAFAMVGGGGDFIAMRGKYVVSCAGKSEGQQNDPCTSIIRILLLPWDLESK